MNNNDEIPIPPDAEDVHGLHGRVKLKKHDTGKGDGNWMELEREKLQAYEYLCHVGEAKVWIEACIRDQISAIENLEQDLRNGVILARLAKVFRPECVKRIFEDPRLQYRHSDNINYFFSAARAEGLPDVFIFELTDLYDKKNIPKVIYCIHALSHLLAKKGLAPRIENLLGKLHFTDEVLDATAQNLEDAAVAMPAFGNLQNALAKELQEEPAVETEEEKLQKHYNENLEKIVKAQAQARTFIARKEFKSKLERFNSYDWTKLQAMIKAKKARADYLKRLHYLHEQVKDTVKIQAWWKGALAARQYRALIRNQGADPKALQNYLVMLEDGANDFDEELDVEALRKEVIRKIRENLASETELNELDMKIALLVKNRISLEEVIHYTSKKMRAALAENAANAEKNAEIITLKGNDKETRERRKHYQELFYLLQTQPSYMAKLMFTMNKKSGASVTRFLEQVVLTLYGYAQNTREEYLFLSLIDAAISTELNDISKLDEFLRDNPLFIKLVLQYTRGAKERQFLRDLLQPLIKLVLDDNQLELETDPVAIYKARIREEEIRTGEKSQRPYDVTPAQAAADPEVKEVQTEAFEKLTTITKQFLASIIGSVKSMPYGMRNIAMKMQEHMKKKFPDSEDESNKIVGNLIYYRYMNPAIVAPEAFDVIETAISPIQRKNLAEIAKVLHHISINRPILGEQSDALATFNSFISHSSKRFASFLKEVSTVVSAQEYFGMDPLIDMGRQDKPVIYITPDEVIQVHRNLLDNIDSLCSSKDDPLRVILNELGTPPPADSGAKGPNTEVALALTNRFAKVEDEDEAQYRHLLSETKRQIMVIIRIQVEKSLLEILESTSTEAHERAFSEVLKQEEARALSRKAADQEKSPMKPSPSSELSQVATDGGASPGANSIFGLLLNSDGTGMTFAQFKRKALENMAKLEEKGTVTKTDKYQSMLNVIVNDVINKQRRRAQRKRELQSLKMTLANLEEKSKFFNDSKKSYHDYIDACMAQLSNKKGKAKKPPMFSKQYYHIRDLQKNGKVPQFGSFKYSAVDLHKKGVLISIDDYSPKQYNQIALTISSDEAGVFKIEASFLGVKLPESMELRLEDLLQMQYNKVDVVTLFDMARVNVNLLVFLINKKFYL